MNTSFEQLVDLFNKTAELRRVITQLQANPTTLESVKEAMMPAAKILLEQFEKEGSQEEFKKILLEKVVEHYNKQIDNFFMDVEFLKNFTK